MQLESIYSIPADHPCLAGHFPGQPLVPAVILLEMLQSCLEQEYPGATISKISKAKFSHALSAEVAVKVVLESAGDNLHFCIHTDSKQEIATGQFSYFVKNTDSEHE